MANFPFPFISPSDREANQNRKFVAQSLSSQFDGCFALLTSHPWSSEGSNISRQPSFYVPIKLLLNSLSHLSLLSISSHDSQPTKQWQSTQRFPTHNSSPAITILLLQNPISLPFTYHFSTFQTAYPYTSVTILCFPPSVFYHQSPFTPPTTRFHPAYSLFPIPQPP